MIEINSNNGKYFIKYHSKFPINEYSPYIIELVYQSELYWVNETFSINIHHDTLISTGGFTKTFNLSYINNTIIDNKYTNIHFNQQFNRAIIIVKIIFLQYSNNAQLSINSQYHSRVALNLINKTCCNCQLFTISKFPIHLYETFYISVVFIGEYIDLGIDGFDAINITKAGIYNLNCMTVTVKHLMIANYVHFNFSINFKSNANLQVLRIGQLKYVIQIYPVSLKLVSNEINAASDDTNTSELLYTSLKKYNMLKGPINKTYTIKMLTNEYSYISHFKMNPSVYKINMKNISGRKYELQINFRTVGLYHLTLALQNEKNIIHYFAIYENNLTVILEPENLVEGKNLYCKTNTVSAMYLTKWECLYGPHTINGQTQSDKYSSKEANDILDSLKFDIVDRKHYLHIYYVIFDLLLKCYCIVTNDNRYPQKYDSNVYQKEVKKYSPLYRSYQFQRMNAVNTGFFCASTVIWLFVILCLFSSLTMLEIIQHKNALYQELFNQTFIFFKPPQQKKSYVYDNFYFDYDSKESRKVLKIINDRYALLTAIKKMITKLSIQLKNQPNWKEKDLIEEDLSMLYILIDRRECCPVFNITQYQIEMDNLIKLQAMRPFKNTDLANLKNTMIGHADGQLDVKTQFVANQITKRFAPKTKEFMQKGKKRDFFDGLSVKHDDTKKSQIKDGGNSKMKRTNFNKHLRIIDPKVPKFEATNLLDRAQERKKLIKPLEKPRRSFKDIRQPRIIQRRSTFISKLHEQISEVPMLSTHGRFRSSSVSISSPSIASLNASRQSMINSRAISQSVVSLNTPRLSVINSRPYSNSVGSLNIPRQSMFNSRPYSQSVIYSRPYSQSVGSLNTPRQSMFNSRPYSQSVGSLNTPRQSMFNSRPYSQSVGSLNTPRQSMINPRAYRQSMITSREHRQSIINPGEYRQSVNSRKSTSQSQLLTTFPRKPRQSVLDQMLSSPNKTRPSIVDGKINDLSTSTKVHRPTYCMDNAFRRSVLHDTEPIDTVQAWERLLNRDKSRKSETFLLEKADRRKSFKFQPQIKKPPDPKILNFHLREGHGEYMNKTESEKSYISEIRYSPPKVLFEFPENIFLSKKFSDSFFSRDTSKKLISSSEVSNYGNQKLTRFGTIKKIIMDKIRQTTPCTMETFSQCMTKDKSKTPITKRKSKQDIENEIKQVTEPSMKHLKISEDIDQSSELTTRSSLPNPRKRISLLFQIGNVLFRGQDSRQSDTEFRGQDSRQSDTEV